jgi:hypothetical protein
MPIPSGAYLPDDVVQVDQILTSVNQAGNTLAATEGDGYVEVDTGLILLGFSLVEEISGVLTPAEAWSTRMAQPGQPIRYTVDDLWTSAGTLWQQNAGVMAWQLLPFGNATTSTTYVNCCDLASGHGYTRPGSRFSATNNLALGLTSTATRIWVIGQSSIGTLTWDLYQTTSGGTSTSLATGTITSLTPVVSFADYTWTPTAGNVNYQMKFKSSSGAVSCRLWGWGFYLSGV